MPVTNFSYQNIDPDPGNPDRYPSQATGFIFLDQPLPQDSFYLPPLIVTDYENTFGEPPSFNFITCRWALYINIRSFDFSTCSLFSGLPEKRKFGQIGFGTSNTVVDYSFVTTNLQQFRTKQMVISPLTGNIPLEPSEIIVIGERSRLIDARALYWGGIGLDFTAIFADTFFLDLDFSIDCDLIIEYFCNYTVGTGFADSNVGVSII